jgi:hypothetical protein
MFREPKEESNGLLFMLAQGSSAQVEQIDATRFRDLGVTRIINVVVSLGNLPVHSPDS